MQPAPQRDVDVLGEALREMRRVVMLMLRPASLSNACYLAVQ